jgi:hypothetical protein
MQSETYARIADRRRSFVYPRRRSLKFDAAPDGATRLPRNSEGPPILVSGSARPRGTDRLPVFERLRTGARSFLVLPRGTPPVEATGAAPRAVSGSRRSRGETWRTPMCSF